MSDKKWDAFISHASEDKAAIVEPLSVALQTLGVSVWYDEFELKPGDSLSKSIDEGLAESRFGIVVLSRAFLGKPWTDRELRGLVAKEIDEGRPVILPIWYGVTRKQVRDFSPPLADVFAVNTSTTPAAGDIAIALLRVVRPDLYSQHPRAELERRLSGLALGDLKKELERTNEELQKTLEELAPYKCPDCGAPLVSSHQQDFPEDHCIVTFDTSECGHQTADGYTERPCPTRGTRTRPADAPYRNPDDR
ncbi:MAG: toll/interleukin-1 receptor domain-containing protein [Vicinamibacterales bacterium]